MPSAASPSSKTTSCRFAETGWKKSTRDSSPLSRKALASAAAIFARQGRAVPPGGPRVVRLRGQQQTPRVDRAPGLQVCKPQQAVLAPLEALVEAPERAHRQPRAAHLLLQVGPQADGDHLQAGRQLPEAHQRRGVEAADAGEVEEQEAEPAAAQHRREVGQDRRDAAEEQVRAAGAGHDDLVVGAEVPLVLAGARAVRVHRRVPRRRHQAQRATLGVAEDEAETAEDETHYDRRRQVCGEVVQEDGKHHRVLPGRKQSPGLPESIQQIAEGQVHQQAAHHHLRDQGGERHPKEHPQAAYGRGREPADPVDPSRLHIHARRGEGDVADRPQRGTRQGRSAAGDAELRSHPRRLLGSHQLDGQQRRQQVEHEHHEQGRDGGRLTCDDAPVHLGHLQPVQP